MHVECRLLTADQLNFADNNNTFIAFRVDRIANASFNSFFLHIYDRRNYRTNASSSPISLRFVLLKPFQCLIGFASFFFFTSFVMLHTEFGNMFTQTTSPISGTIKNGFCAIHLVFFMYAVHLEQFQIDVDRFPTTFTFLNTHFVFSNTDDRM